MSCGCLDHTCEVEATDIVEIGILDELPDLGLLQMVEAIAVGSTKVGNETTVVASDDRTTTTSLVLSVDTILNAQASLFDGVMQDGSVLVVADAAEVDDAVGRQEVLGATGAVLSGTASNQRGVVVVEQILEDGNVLLFGEDGVVGLEVVLVQQSLVADSLDICN